jgi:hypothetical protein
LRRAVSYQPGGADHDAVADRIGGILRGGEIHQALSECGDICEVKGMPLTVPRS